MYAVEIIFDIKKKKMRETQDYLLGNLMCLWSKRGQIESPFHSRFKQGKQFKIYTTILEKDALSDKYKDKLTKMRFKELKKGGLSAPKVTILGKEEKVFEACDCKEHTGFVLLSDHWKDEPPLKCKACFKPIPLYKIPNLEEDVLFSVGQWEKSYKAYLEVYYRNSLVKKISKEFFSLKSELTKQGREICQKIEKASGVKTFYYVHRLQRAGKRVFVENCPSCEKKWFLKKQLHYKIDYDCEACRLVGNLGW